MVIVKNRMTKHSRDLNLKSELKRMGGGGGEGGWRKMSHVGVKSIIAYFHGSLGKPSN